MLLRNQKRVEIMLDPRNSSPIKVRSPKQDGADSVHVGHIGGGFGVMDSVAQGNERSLSHEAAHCRSS